MIPSDPAAFWTMVAALVAVLVMVASGLAFAYRKLRAGIEKGFEPIREENRRLREELEHRFHYPQFAKNVVALTQTAAERRVEELRREHEDALAAHDEEAASQIADHLRRIDTLRAELARASSEKTRLEEALLQMAVEARPPRKGGNAIGLPTGRILIVRHQNCYGAVQAVDQGSSHRGAFIRYAWWYQPDGSGSFISETVQSGFGEVGEGRPGSPPILEIGPIRLEWSCGSEGVGWVYFGPSSTPDVAYELGIAREVDISIIDATRVPISKHASFVAEA